MYQNKPQMSAEENPPSKSKGQLVAVAESYDRGIVCGRLGTDSYGDLPEGITSDPDYPAYFLREEGLTGSGHNGIREFLSPAAGMQFVDLGCCLNLILRGYDGWPSAYHGVDISGETIGLLREFTEEKRLSVGSLHYGSIHETPYKGSTFDIGACIGVHEYFKRDFVTKALAAPRAGS